jgi:hypothetical protein
MFCCPMNNPPPQAAPIDGSKPEPGFDAEFQAAIEEWRKRHGLREDDAVLLCLELFRIHQDHWDRLRRKELPSFQDLRDSLSKLGETLTILQRDTSTLLEALHQHRGGQVWIPPTVAAILLAIGAALGAGILIGRFCL